LLPLSPCVTLRVDHRYLPEICSCGAALPPDAVFCHKCGKPQRDIVAPEVERNLYPAAAPATPPVAPPPPEAQPLPLDFSNRIAVRIALVAAISATFLSFLVPILNWLAAGFFAVFFYGRKTGFRVDVRAGVRIGWITGLLTYGFAAIVFSAELLPDAISGKLGPTILEQMKNFSAQDPATLQQMTRLMQTPSGITLLVVFGLFFLFVFVMCLSMAGGALGAKMIGRH
jgi:hypothetical protein